MPTTRSHFPTGRTWQELCMGNSMCQRGTDTILQASCSACFKNMFMCSLRGQISYMCSEQMKHTASGQGLFLNGHDCSKCSDVFASAASLYNSMVTSARVLGRYPYTSSSFKRLKHVPSAKGMSYFLSASPGRE